VVRLETPILWPVTDDAGGRAPGRSRESRVVAWLVPALVLAAVALVVLVDRDVHEVSGSDRGSLTPEQYVTAVGIARKEIAQGDATVTAAVATVVRRSRRLSTSDTCGSGPQIVVDLVGTFPDVAVSTMPGTPTGPDTWLTVRADVTTGDQCLTGISLGRFSAPAGAANLLPAL
jgi:hypothetical protein